MSLLNSTYNRRFFSICCLALVCEEGELRRRMTEGRGIREPEWIQSSLEYNRYFQMHTSMEGLPFETLDITKKSVLETADFVVQWVLHHLR